MFASAIRAHRNPAGISLVVLGTAILMAVGACKRGESDPAAGAPPPAKITTAYQAEEFSVDRPDQYPVTAALEHRATAQLAVTGTVNPDIDRTVPVISLASGRIVGIFARLGDEVKKGQLLLRLRSDDISGAFASYQSNVADEVLAKAQLDRMELLYAKGAYALNDLQVAQDAEAKAKIAVDAAAEHLRLLAATWTIPQAWSISLRRSPASLPIRR